MPLKNLAKLLMAALAVQVGGTRASTGPVEPGRTTITGMGSTAKLSSNRLK